MATDIDVFNVASDCQIVLYVARGPGMSICCMGRASYVAWKEHHIVKCDWLNIQYMAHNVNMVCELCHGNRKLCRTMWLWCVHSVEVYMLIVLRFRVCCYMKHHNMWYNVQHLL